MYTRCPHCLTVFMVGAEQLKAAHGNVRCGTCFESFDAIPHLSDGPVPPPGAPAHDADDGTHDSADDTPHTPPQVGGDHRSASEQLSSTLDALRSEGSLQDESPATGPAPDAKPQAVSDGEAASHAALDDGAYYAGDDEPPVEQSTPWPDAFAGEPVGGGDGELPEVLREELDDAAAARAARRRNIGFGAAAAALVMLLVGQYVFFMPDDAVRRYPQWRGAIESMCVRIGCVLPERRDPTRIRVISRDVRVHPRYEGVLQIKATLTNVAPFRQPYPRVRFTLFNVNGQTIATRVFRPSEYLGRHVASSARLRPETPFQVELDVLAPEEAAVSFEFQFL